MEQNREPRETRPVKKPSLGKKLLTVGCILLASLVIAVGVGAVYLNSLLGNVEREELDENDLGISSSAGESLPENEPQTGGTGEFSSQDVTNIALFGVDTRQMDSTSGRSDAIMVLSLDRVHGKVKLTSIARDSYVQIEGRGWDKLNHAYAYGGPQLAVKTLNQNFGLDIRDFVTVNFAQLAQIIDYAGGVTVNVSEAERDVANTYIEELNHLSIQTDPITGTGDLRLTGGQAVAYARNRYTGSDLDRTDRQREILEGLFQSALTMSPAKLPGFAGRILSGCVTSLTGDEMVEMGLWALSARPGMEQASLPNAACNASGETINGVWYFVYDLSNAGEILRQFVYEDISPA